MKEGIDLFQEEIASASSLLILIPKEPNFDQVAAGLSLYLTLSAYGKSVAVACPTPMIVEFNRLVGVNKVDQELGNKNLTIKFSGYRADGIERVSYNIEDGQFMLTVVPKPNVPAPRQDQIVFSFSGVAADLVFLVGFSGKEDFGNFDKDQNIFDKKLYLIGIHPAQGLPQVQEIVFPDASCLSEVAARIINRSNLPLDGDIAGNLYMGIERGTGRFSSPKVSAETFELIAQLIRSGAKGQVRQEAPRQQIVEPEEKPPKDWLEPKVYKGSTLP